MTYTVSQHFAKPYTLSLSSGFFGFFAHAGFCESLSEHLSPPTHITGSSAGALIGCMIACGLNVSQIKHHLFDMNKDDFWDPSPGLGWLKGQKFRAKLRDIVGQRNFEDTDIPFSVSAYHPRKHRTLILNKGDLIEGVYASCAVPLLFQPAVVNGMKLLDGGVLDRPGIASAPNNLPILYHHIHSKSAWRRHVPVPQRENLSFVTIPDLPRSGPNKLNLGPNIYAEAKRRSDTLWQQEYNDQLYI